MRRPRESIARSAGAWRRRISATWRPIWRLLLLQRRRDGSRRSSPPARRRPCTQRRNTAAHVCRRQRTGARTGPPRTAGLAAARLGGVMSWRAVRARARNGCHCTMAGIIALAKTSKIELNRTELNCNKTHSTTVTIFFFRAALNGTTPGALCLRRLPSLRSAELRISRFLFLVFMITFGTCLCCSIRRISERWP